MPNIIANNITKKYRSKGKNGNYIMAINNVSFKVKAGEVVGILGMNGAGKSTLIKLMCGILAPTSGSIVVNSFVPFEKKNEYLRSISLVSGNKTQLDYDLSAKDNFALLRSIYDINKADYVMQVQKLMAMFKCEHLYKKQIRRLSFGERMKFEIIGALIHSPQIVFLDEPTIGLDVVAQRDFREFIREYNKGKDKIVFITSHNVSDISELCDRIILINDGILEFDGTIGEFCDCFNTSRKIISITLKPNVAENKLRSIFKDRCEIIAIDESQLNVEISVTETECISTAKYILNQFEDCIEKMNVNDSNTENIIKAKLLGAKA